MLIWSSDSELQNCKCALGERDSACPAITDANLFKWKAVNIKVCLQSALMDCVFLCCQAKWQVLDGLQGRERLYLLLVRGGGGRAEGVEGVQLQTGVRE